MKPQEPIPHNYRMSTLNKIFAISSIVLLGLTGALVMYDYVRGWKRFQWDFLRLQEERIQQELDAAKKSQSRAEMKKLDLQVRDQEREIARRKEQFREAQKKLDEWEGRHYAADQDFRFTKAVLDAKRYEAESAVLRKARNQKEKLRDLAEYTERLSALKYKLEEVTRNRDAARARVDVWLKRITEAEAAKKEMTATTERLTKQLGTVEANAPFFILNAPLLDFVAPTFKIDQAVMKDLFLDLNYMSVPRVDRCMTCHRAIDRTGFESKKEAARLQGELEDKLEKFQIPRERVAETEERIEQLKRIQSAAKGIRNPFRTHPYLDSFVGSASPHPLQDFGCTVCHHGEGRATDFARAGHMPMSRKQEKRWRKDLGWKPQPFLEWPMHPRQHMQASCNKCHGSQMVVDRGPAVTNGGSMIELYGCVACHKIDTWRFSNLRKPGPDLNGIAEKTTPQWAIRWLMEPHDFRSTTRMPSFFYQRNMVGPAVPPQERIENSKKQNAEIHAIVSYLFAKSTRRQWSPAPGSGDPARGEQLVSSVGCMGCHIAQDTFKDPEGAVRSVRRDDFPIERHYGFNLTGTGTKVDANWLFHWLKNPKNYYDDAPMPSLRLSDQEAADISAYLMSLQKPQFMSKGVPPLDRLALRQLTRSYMISTMSERDADRRVDSMSPQEQLVFLGQRTIEKYGCYSCHELKGFEKAKPIGTELTIEGSKTLHLFDFGFVHDYEAHDGKHEHIDHTVHSWIYSKVRSPRVWDDKRQKDYQDKLKMPNFHLSVAEANAITGVVLGMTDDRVSDNKLASRDANSRLVEEGRKRVSQRNCRGCHIVDGSGRAIEPTIAEPGMLPPDLSPEGARVQSDWLFNFLKDPTVMTMRPWLSVRMPTFHFSDHEATTLVNYFAAEANAVQFDTTKHIAPQGKNVAIGRAVFQVLKCVQCHPTGAVATAPVNTASVAPDLALARARLRHAWIPDWIRRPNEMIPGTAMPTNFPRSSETGGFESPLPAMIDMPEFSSQRASLLSSFGSEEAMLRAIGNPEEITGYLRDYIWSIGPSQMRLAQPAPGGPAPPVTPATATPTAPALQSTRGETVPAGPAR